MAADEVFVNQLTPGMFPPGSSDAFRLYLIQSGQDVTNAGRAAGEASQIANQANNTANTANDTAETANQTANQTKQEVDTALNSLDQKYVSKELSSNQVIQAGGGNFCIGAAPLLLTDKLYVVGSINATVSLKVAGLQVVSSRDTGWSEASGSAFKGSFNASATFPVDAAYNQAQMQTMANALTEARQAIKALKDLLKYHGLTN